MNIIRDRDARPEQLLGGKAHAFAALRKADLPIPRWFVVTPEAFDSLGLTTDAALELGATVAEMFAAGEMLAVRSSAIEEDAAQHSFAGQFETFLFVSPAEVTDKVVAVWRSAATAHAAAYRREKQVTGGLGMAVIVQRMVNASAAGVAFSADPVTGRRGTAVVAATSGVGAALVAGETDGDTYEVNRTGQITSRKLAKAAPVLTDEQVCAIADLARQTERVFARPQDIEWAIEGGRLYLLQSRPITTVAALADPDGQFDLWDNSNIVESYGGITTPLTYSFVRPVYEQVYRQFCRIMGVPERIIRENGTVFARMVGLIKGRIYYNLLNWYRLLALLPGYKFNRKFMEQMMGVKEALPEDALPQPVPASAAERLRDGLALLRSIVGMMVQYCALPRNMARFYRRVGDALGERRPDLSRLRPDELIAYYRSLERQLLTRWDTPLVNDFFAMIFYGVLRKLTSAWVGGGGTLHNDLLCGGGGMISTEPARWLRHMATLAADHPELLSALRTGTADEITRALASHPTLNAAYREYLDRFGDRCPDELKLESAGLHEDPLPLLRTLGQLAERLRDSGLGKPAAEANEQRVRADAEHCVRAKLACSPLRRLIFWWVLKNARARVRDRENLRFERTRVFGRVRMIFTELGRRLYAADQLDDTADIFYLELSDVFGFAEGTAACTDLKALVKLRRAEFAHFAASNAPTERFETRGMVHHANGFRDTKVRAVTSDSPHSRRGLGCCPGVVRGRVRVVRDAHDLPSESGCVLVAERTDPSWILIFPSAAGVLVERGSLLSHSAIVARELGIPTVVSVAGLTEWLHDGDLVELDGGSGVITRLADFGNSPAFHRVGLASERGSHDGESTTCNGDAERSARNSATAAKFVGTAAGQSAAGGA